jgi:glycogenin
MKAAYVTTLCNGDGYVPGVEALGGSLQASGSRYPRVLLATADVPDEARRRLAAVGWEVRPIEPIENPNPETQRLFARFGNAFTKLRAWELTDLDKVVLLDADTIVLQNVDDLFERPSIAAAPDFFLPDRFNSGVMVLEPSAGTFARMVDALAGSTSYDGGDQGFLNTFYPGWYAMPVEHRLPVGYNMFHFNFQFMRGHPNLREVLEREVKIVHYMVQKPWRVKSTLTGGSKAWWEAYFRVHPEEATPWKRRMHAAEDWTFDKVIGAILG